MPRPQVPGAAILAVTVALSLVAVPVAAHTNHVEADAQHSVDGTVLLEWEFVGTDGWVAVRGDDGGEPGAVLGHRRVTPREAFRTDTAVRIDEAVWADWAGSRTVWVVLHQEDGGEGFDPEDDPMQTGFGGDPAGSRIVVERADGPARVTAQSFQPENSTDGTVTVRRVELPEPGYVAVHAVDGDVAANVGDEDVGDPGGAVHLEAGVHDNVTVELDEAALARAEPQELLSTVLYTGSDRFEADSTEPVTAGDTLVRTTFGVEFGSDVVEGPTPTPTVADEEMVTTPEPAATSSARPTSSGTPTSGDGAGVGPLVAAVALALGGLPVARRAR
jgi:hypothetical protein